MAHAANLKRLGEGLVISTTGRTPENRAFNRLIERTLRNLKDHSHARTNQFAVKAKLYGLVEKFSVLNREELATLLEAELNDLPKDSRWMPEILSLLLELSDRPVENTSLEEIQNEAQAKAAEESLTWDEIFGNEPVDDPEVWEDVERGYHSSGDDEFYQESEPTTSTKATSLDEEDPASIAKLYLTQPDEKCLENVKSARKQAESLKQHDGSHTLSELVVVREIISMLHGLPTDMFDVDEDGRVALSSTIRINGATSSTLLDLLSTAADTGTAINSLRQWVPEAAYSYLQSFHGAIEKEISSLGAHLDSVEQRYVTPAPLTTVSALDVQTEIDDVARPLVHLSAVVERASAIDAAEAPFALLDELYDETCTAHLTGDLTLFEVLAAVFLAGFTTYLRPVGTWITRGAIVPQDREVLLAEDYDQDCEPGSLWQRRFKMRTLVSGAPYTPSCISSKAKMLFALGKSRAFLNQLERNGDWIEDQHLAPFLPDFDRFMDQLAANPLAPFSQMLDDTLDSWIIQISTDCSPVLRAKLFHEYELKRTLVALPLLFFSQDGILFQEFANTITGRMSSSQHLVTWDDQFMLTELAQSTFGSSYEVDAASVYVTLDEEKEKTTARSLVRRLAIVTVGHRLSWSVQNVIHLKAPDAHSKTFTFLLQIFCAGNMLQDRFLDFRARQPATPAALKLRQNLLWFTNSLFNYTTTTAQALHKTMVTAMERAADIDEMVAEYAAYEKRLEMNLLLATNLEPVRDAVIGILELSEVLAKTDQEGRIVALQNEFDKNVKFLTAGIRGVGRAGGESFLERLAEILEWGVR